MRIPNREDRVLSLGQFLALSVIIGVVNWLLWSWVKISPEEGSAALAAMSVWGFGVVALPATFLIGVMGLHLASRRQSR